MPDENKRVLAFDSWVRDTALLLTAAQWEEMRDEGLLPASVELPEFLAFLFAEEREARAKAWDGLETHLCLTARVAKHRGLERYLKAASLGIKQTDVWNERLQRYDLVDEEGVPTVWGLEILEWMETRGRHDTVGRSAEERHA